MKKVFNPSMLSLNFCVTLLLFFSFDNVAQNFPTGEFIVGHYTSDYVLDAQFGSLSPNAQVWLTNLNQNIEQHFLFEPVGVPADRIFRIKNVQSSLYLTAKISPATHKTPGILSTSKNYVIIQDKAYRMNTKSELSSLQSDARNQYWKLTPITNAGPENIYVLKNVRFENKVLRGEINKPGTALNLVSYVAGRKDQMWQLRILPKPPKNLRVEYAYHQSTKRISGKIYWQDNSTNETGFKIIAVQKDARGTIIGSFEVARQVPPNTTSYAFSFDERNSANGKNKEHCFYMRALLGGFHSTESNQTCQIAAVESLPPPPPPPPSSGVRVIHVYNCHSERKEVNLWTYDLTVNNGVWEHRGSMASQWVNGSCPLGLPFAIPLKDGHSYILKAIDCGSNPPNNTSSICHKLTTINPIPGKTGGSILVQTVQ